MRERENMLLRFGRVILGIERELRCGDDGAAGWGGGSSHNLMTDADSASKVSPSL